MKSTNNLPIAIIGAGPIGLAAAAHLSSRKRSFLILEAGPQVADSVRGWQHVPMFSPWKFNIDAKSMDLLQTYDWVKPKDDYIPTGKELIEDYLLPLSETIEIKPFIRLNARVFAISRKRINKMKNFGRERAPFVLYIQGTDGFEKIYVSAVIDASGTWKNPMPSGSDGLPVIGERDNRKISYGIPDIFGESKYKYAGKDVAVIGGGHSAINSLLELADVKKDQPAMRLYWILRKSMVEDAYGGLDNDELPGRGQVGQKIKELVDTAKVKVLTPFFVEEIIDGEEEKVKVTGQTSIGVQAIEVDQVIVATGLRPDLEMIRELRIEVDQVIESPVNLAPHIDPNIHSCGSVKPHGEAELRHPEKDFYVVGMKSYGRAPTFLLATGYEQVRSVVAGLCGDWEAAREVRLNLPETGVCGVPIAVDPNNLEIENGSSACCEPSVVDAETKGNSNCC